MVTFHCNDYLTYCAINVYRTAPKPKREGAAEQPLLAKEASDSLASRLIIYADYVSLHLRARENLAICVTGCLSHTDLVVMVSGDNCSKGKSRKS